MSPLTDMKVFNTNLIRVVLIFDHINMNGIMTKSFFEVLFFVFYSFTPEIQMKGAFFVL